MRAALWLLPWAAAGVPQSVVFDYAWRFHHGDEPSKAARAGVCEFEPLQRAECTGMDNNPNRFSEHDCEMACCYDADCEVYQVNSAGNGAKNCFHGGKGATCKTVTKGGYPAGGRKTAAPHPPANRTDLAFAQRAFDDSAWPVVNAPHDFVINGTFGNDGDVHHGFLPRNVSWYRKHFRLPDSWKGRTVEVEFEGVFHYASIFLNGVPLLDHLCGYTGFTVRLDNSTALQWGADNVLAVRVDASFGSGHWYEGGGLYRPVHLHSLPPLHFTADGVFASPEGTGRSLKVEAELESHAGTETASVDFTLYDGAAAVGQCSSESRAVSSAAVQSCTIPPTRELQQWSVRSPKTYRLFAKIAGGADERNVTVGFRTAQWDGNTGFHLNGQEIKLRGFSHHNSFAGVGVALPDRLSLLKVQATRALGGNIWRMSHNPYAKGLYGLLDALGVLVWDENRDYGLPYVNDMHDMVKRDRNHPSIVIWSFCNEYECGQQQNRTGPKFRSAAKNIDPDRAVGANGNVDSMTYSPALDVQGHSHANENTFESFHQKFPAVPQVLSECCSCTQSNQRLPLETRGLPQCIQAQNSPGLLPYVAGSLGVWTLFDYYGEQHSWPNVACSYGQFDIAGFPKPHAHWYRANWLAGYAQGDASRPPLPEVHVARVLSLTPAWSAQGTATISGVVSTDEAELFVDGRSQGTRAVTPGEQFDWVVNTSARASCTFPTDRSGVQCHGLQAEKGAGSVAECKAACCQTSCSLWQFSASKGCWLGTECGNPTADSTWAGGERLPEPVANATLVAIAGGQPLARHVQLGSTKAVAALRVTIDAPSPSTGTGSKVLLDAKDVALLGVALVDSSGVLLPRSAANVSFRVVSGPGVIAGVGNGDPASHVHTTGSTTDTYGGVARGLVKASVDCVSRNRELALSIDSDPAAARRPRVAAACPGDSAITVQVSTDAAGVAPVTVSIPVSGAVEEDSPLAVAARTVDLSTWTYTEDFAG
eukprot:TRINITY_DN6932_c0_g1_i1.p1 TRINITY_DN6932_c0_g1~~TRINITY_DN6932_c0_g1_i1.p1  ORF type:complete len:1025 (+),score=273.18 TRINITY_DN6932_c0_g1_i1:110-3076(+)